MSRRRRAEKTKTGVDPRYESELVARFVNYVMRKGKKTTAQNIVYGAMDVIAEKTEQDALEVLTRAVDNVKPKVEVKSRRVGGATYQVPIEISRDRQMALAMRWLIMFSTGRKGMPMKRALAIELMDAFGNQGNAIKRRDDTHKMAQANRAFAHYRW